MIVNHTNCVSKKYYTTCVFLCRLRDGYSNQSYTWIAHVHCKYAFYIYDDILQWNQKKTLPYNQIWPPKFGFDANVSLSFSTNAPHSIKLNRIFFSCLSPALYLFTVDRFSEMRNLSFHLPLVLSPF